MPIRRCCYCGKDIEQDKKSYKATEENLENAIEHRKLIGKDPLLNAFHLCTTCRRHGFKKPKENHIPTVSVQRGRDCSLQ